MDVYLGTILAAFSGITGVVLVGVVTNLVTASIQTRLSLANRHMKRVFRKIFDKSSILILGSGASGKTALRCFLLYNKPLARVGRKWQKPDPTSVPEPGFFGTAIIDSNTELPKTEKARLFHLNKLADIGSDLPGDRNALVKQVWTTFINGIDPHGIIYMLDSRLEGASLERELEWMFENVLEHYQYRTRRLVSFHIFANFIDLWKHTPDDEVSKTYYIKNYIRMKLEDPSYRHIAGRVHFDVSFTQLSPDKTLWTEAQKAIQKFGRSIESQMRNR